MHEPTTPGVFNERGMLLSIPTRRRQRRQHLVLPPLQDDFRISQPPPPYLPGDYESSSPRFTRDSETDMDKSENHRRRSGMLKEALYPVPRLMTFIYEGENAFVHPGLTYQVRPFRITPIKYKIR
jgi:hypothetical protein